MPSKINLQYSFFPLVLGLDVDLIVPVPELTYLLYSTPRFLISNKLPCGSLTGDVAVFVVSTKNEKSVFSSGDFNFRVSVSVIATESLVFEDVVPAVSTAVTTDADDSITTSVAAPISFGNVDEETSVPTPAIKYEYKLYQAAMACGTKS